VFSFGEMCRHPDPALGICWLHKDSDKLVAGTVKGTLRLYSAAGLMAASAPAQEPNTNATGVTITQQPASGARKYILQNYIEPTHLTSVNVNADDTKVIASGYSTHISMHDLATGKLLRVFREVHTGGHINVIKFAYQNPNLIATSAFEGCVKLLDIRQPVRCPPAHVIVLPATQDSNIHDCGMPRAGTGSV
jgi:WD40 repeat protein